MVVSNGLDFKLQALNGRATTVLLSEKETSDALGCLRSVSILHQGFNKVPSSA